jgi:hypothetical protein
MSKKFKEGDRVRKVDGTPFSNGELVVTVERYTSYGNPWFFETQSHLDEHKLVLVNVKPKALGISKFIKDMEEKYAS